MSTLVRTPEAARILGVTPATLYSYVSRGRINRKLGPDGRSSLFDREALERLAASQGRRREPRPTIDVQIGSDITVLGETDVEYRGHRVADLARETSFERVAGLLWTGTLPERAAWPVPGQPATDAGTTTSPSVLTRTETELLNTILERVTAVIEAGRIDRSDASAVLSAVALVGGTSFPELAPAPAARLMIAATPTLMGATKPTGSVAERLASVWHSNPSAQLVAAVNTALVLLADHGLATSTLAARVATSVRCTSFDALAAGLAALRGVHHGAAPIAAHSFLEHCSRRGAATVIGELRSNQQRVPGFGHKIYRGTDPRVEPLFSAVYALASPQQRATLDDVMRTAATRLTVLANVDIALGALSWVAGLPPTSSLFAIARTAGWAAHIVEELDAPPVRFRGLAHRPT